MKSSGTKRKRMKGTKREHTKARSARSSEQTLQRGAQHHQIHSPRDVNIPFGELDLDRPQRRRRSRLHNFHCFHLSLIADRYRQEFLRCVVSQTPFTIHPSPKKKLIGVQRVALCYSCHRRPRQERLLCYPSFSLDRPAPPQPNFV